MWLLWEKIHFPIATFYEYLIIGIIVCEKSEYEGFMAKDVNKMGEKVKNHISAGSKISCGNGLLSKFKNIQNYRILIFSEK